jgi:hypothetical protein
MRALQPYRVYGQGSAHDPEGLLGEGGHLIAVPRQAAHRGNGFGEGATAEAELDTVFGDHAQ